MKVDQVIKLLEAGYTKEEIQQMEAGNQEPKEQETPKPEPAAEPPEPEKKPAAAEQDPAGKPEEKGPAAESAPDPETGKRLDGIEQQLKALVKSIQTNNVRRDSYGSAGEDIETKADKALAALIQPHETE